MKKGFSKDNELMWESYMGKKTPLSYDDLSTTETPYDDEEWDTDWEDGITDNEDESELEVMSFEPVAEVETHEGCNEVVYSDIKKLAEYSKRILEICRETELDPWMQAKLVKASDYVSDIWHRIDGKADFANTGFEQSDNISL